MSSAPETVACAICKSDIRNETHDVQGVKRTFRGFSLCQDCHAVMQDSGEYSEIGPGFDDVERRIVTVCPECDSARHESRGTDESATGHRCLNCGEQFDSPMWRPSKQKNSDNRRGLAGELIVANTIDEVFADD
jgi:NMD protein affecting ribosome stability and mRNA decay